MVRETDISDDLSHRGDRMERFLLGISVGHPFAEIPLSEWPQFPAALPVSHSTCISLQLQLTLSPIPIPLIPSVTPCTPPYPAAPGAAYPCCACPGTCPNAGICGCPTIGCAAGAKYPCPAAAGCCCAARPGVNICPCPPTAGCPYGTADTGLGAATAGVSYAICAAGYCLLRGLWCVVVGGGGEAADGWGDG